ncbi:MAG: sporulation integral membrane protein YtvI [Defluviitaleaceae bacterium]|nr:sporulation integral membrane protein YtvI [Defluviitaleaceae bacterium]
MTDFYKANRIYINKFFYTILFFLAVYVSIEFLLPFVAPFVFGYLFSLCLSPAVNWLEKRFRANRGLATAFIMILFILLLGLLINLIAVNVIRQAREFTEALPEYAKQMSETAQELESRFNRFFDLMPSNIRSIFNSASENLEDRATDIMSSLLQIGGGGLIRTIPTALIGTLLWLVSSFFFTKDRYTIKKFIRGKTPDTIANGFKLGKEKMGAALKGYVKAQLTIMSIISVVSIAGLFFMDYPYALLVGIIIAFVDALPLFGSGFIIIPWAIISAIAGNFSRMVSLLALYLAIVLARQFLEPKILGNQLGIHPILTLISIYVGLRLFGILGIIVGPISVVMAVGLFSSAPETKYSQ